MRLDLLREIPEDASLRRHWNALLSQVEQPQVFYTYEWAQAVHRAYRETLHPLLFLAYDDSTSLCGVAALATGPRRESVSFLCATTGDYCDFLSSAKDRAPFVRAVFAELRNSGVESVRLTNLPADSTSVSAIRQAAGENRLYCHMRTAYVCAQVALSALERRGEGNPVLPRKKMLRRFLNAMGREHPVRLDHSRSWEMIEPVLSEFMRAHVARFLVTGRISNMANPERRMFLAELARLMSDSGSIVLTRLMSGERVFAWNYGFQFQGTWFWYQPTFDTNLEKYSPGFCLLAKVIEEACEDPSLQVVDLGLGAEDYKVRFANRNRKTLFISLESEVFAHFAEIVRDQLSALLRRSRGLEMAVRSAVMRIRRWWLRLSQSGLRGLLGAGLELLRKFLWWEEEISYYQWCGSPQAGEFEIRKLDLNHLASAAIEFCEDRATLDYLLCATQRLRSGEAEGIALISPEGIPVHFAWMTGFRQSGHFQAGTELAPAGVEGILIADSWTPVALRGKHCCTRALELVAAEAKQRGQCTWGCGAASNVAWIQALTKAGFQKRFAISQRRVLGLKVVQPNRTRDEFSAEEASARV